MAYRLFYATDGRGNFGDDLNQWLWKQLLPERFADRSDNWVSVIGTIIDEAKMPEGDKKIVFSSGFGMGAPPKNIKDKSWDVVCVRGPLTAEILDLPADKAVTDGALLLAALPEYAEPVLEDQRRGVYFMPHHDAFTWGGWKEAAEQAGVEFLDPRDDSKETIEKIRYAKLVICDAMHSAIVSDTFRTPWVPVRATLNVNVFKWTDWCCSMGLEYQPISIPPCNVNEYLVRLIRKYIPLPHDKIGSRDTVIRASKAYIRHVRKENKFEPQWFLSKLRTVLSALAIKGANILAKTGLFASINQRLSKKSAQVLEGIASGAVKPTLSADETYRQKLSLMEVKLKELDRLAQS